MSRVCGSDTGLAGSLRTEGLLNYSANIFNGDGSIGCDRNRFRLRRASAEVGSVGT